MKNNKTAIAIGILGITLELIAIVLLATKRVSIAAGTPLVIIGMLLAFVPIFVAARHARRR